MPAIGELCHLRPILNAMNCGVDLFVKELKSTDIADLG
jgi:hypothetical protein